MTQPEEPPVSDPPVTDPPVTDPPVIELPIGGGTGEEAPDAEVTDPPAVGALSATATGGILTAAEAALALLQQDA